MSDTNNKVFTTAGNAMAYKTWQSQKTEPLYKETPDDLFLIHGLASGLRIWDYVGQELVDSTGIPTVAFDQLGHGESDKPDDGYTTPAIVENTRTVIDYFHSKKSVLVGHSWGATIALAYAATYPERTAAVVLVDGGLGNLKDRNGASWEEISQQLAPPNFAGTPREQFLSFFKNGSNGKFLVGQWNAQLEDMLLNIVELRADDTVAPRLSRANHMQILRSMWDTDHYELASQVRCPALLISAEPASLENVGDERTREWLLRKRDGAAQLQAALANSPHVEFKIFAETIHDIPLQRPKELAKTIVEFLKTAKVIR